MLRLRMGAWLMWVLGIVGVLVLLAVIGSLAGGSGSSIDRARAEGLWPPEGEELTDEDVVKLVKAGQKIMAIRMYRKIHHCQLVEAKQFVEELQKQIDQES